MSKPVTEKEWLSKKFVAPLIRCVEEQKVESDRKFRLFDVQFLTPHTTRMGAVEIPRSEAGRGVRVGILDTPIYANDRLAALLGGTAQAAALMEPLVSRAAQAGCLASTLRVASGSW